MINVSFIDQKNRLETYLLPYTKNTKQSGMSPPGGVAIFVYQPGLTLRNRIKTNCDGDKSLFFLVVNKTVNEIKAKIFRIPWKSAR